MYQACQGPEHQHPGIEEIAVVERLLLELRRLLWKILLPIVHLRCPLA